MHPDLEAILAADEESRARVTLASETAERRTRDARAAADAERQRQTSEAEGSVAAEVDAIRREGDGRIEELKREHDAQLRALAAAGDAHFEDAVRAYIDIVCNPEAKR